jgi:hypothetical protein
MGEKDLKNAKAEGIRQMLAFALEQIDSLEFYEGVVSEKSVMKIGSRMLNFAETRGVIIT